MMDMMKMLGKMKEVQAKLKEAQDNLDQVTASAEAGGGMVKATVNGKKRVVSLELEPELINPADQDMLKDLIIAAINKAMEEVDGKAKEALKNSTEGLLPNIPGLDLSGLV
jgi:DNA-binding YbaB/EbfC family protein